METWLPGRQVKVYHMVFHTGLVNYEITHSVHVWTSTAKVPNERTFGSSAIRCTALAEIAKRTSFGTMILRNRCCTSCDLASLFVAGAALYADGVEKSHKASARGRQLCTQLSIFEGSLAELLRFWCCQVQKLRKSSRIVSFLTLSSSKIEEISQNSCVFKLADRQTDRQTDR